MVLPYAAVRIKGFSKEPVNNAVFEKAGKSILINSRGSGRNGPEYV